MKFRPRLWTCMSSGRYTGFDSYAKGERLLDVKNAQG